MVTAADAAKTLNRLADELRRRRPGIVTLDDAYKGKHKLAYASDDFKEFFSDRYSSFTDNWCGIVADAPHERLEITGIRLDGEHDASLFDAWRRANADQGSDLAMLNAINTGRSFALVWADSDGNPAITFEHSAQAIVATDPETGERTAGAKVWSDDETEYATLYLPDEMWKFQRPAYRATAVEQTAETAPLLDGDWQPRAEGVLPNPLGKVPLVEWPNRPQLLGDPLSDIEGALAMQHAVNLFWSELFAVADEATIGQRLVIGAERPVLPVLDESGNVIGEKPVDLKKWRRDRIGWLEDPSAKAHEWQPAKIEPFTDVIEIAVGHIAAQTRTPAHYLMTGGTYANLSADAMKALETGLVKRTEEKTQHFGRAARDVFELVALVEGNQRKATAVRGGQVLWKDVENRSDAQVADAALKDRQIGLPMRYVLEKRYGLSPAEVGRVMDMIEEEQSDPTTRALIETMGGAGGSGDATAEVG